MIDPTQLIGELMQGLLQIATHLDKEVQGGKSFEFKCPVLGADGGKGTLSVTVRLSRDDPYRIRTNGNAEA